MINDKLKQLEALKLKAAALEQQVAAERSKTLAALPKEYGFENVDEFIDAVLESGGRGAGRRGRRGRPAQGASSSRKNGRRPRTTITDEIRKQVKKLAQAGKTGAEIAKTVDISLPSVQNIKKALGLVNARKR